MATLNYLFICTLPLTIDLVLINCVFADNNHDIDLSDNLKQAGKESLSKDLFMSPGTQDTSKLNKKVTFNDSLTTTKVYDEDKSGIQEHHDSDLSVTSKSLSLKTLSETSAINPSDVQFFIKPHNTAPATPSFSFSSSPFNAGNCKSVEQNEDAAIVKSTRLVSAVLSNASSINNTNSVSTQQSGLTSTPTSSSDTRSTTPSVASDNSLAGIRNAKPFEFNFSTTSSQATNDKESIGFYPTKGLSGDNTLKTPEVVLPSSAKSSLANTKKDEKEVITATSPETARSSGENKNSFSLFPNKENIKTESSKIGYENQPFLNGLAPTTNISSSPFAFNTTATQASSNKPVSSNLGTNLNSSTLNSSSSPFITTSKSSNLTITSPDSSSLKESLSSNQHVQSFTMFSNATGSTSQPHQSIFENNFKSPSNLSAFEDGALKVGLYKTELTNQASILSLGDSKFGGATTAQSNSTTVTTTNQSNGLFGNLSNNITPKQNMFGAVDSSTTQPSNQIFGSSMASTTPQASCTSFGILSNNTVASQSNNGFASQLAPTQSQGLFGNALPTTNPQISTFSTASQSTGQPTLLREGVSNSQVSKSLFQTSVNPTPAFGTLSNTPSTTGFEIQSKPTSFGFGNQANLPSSPFGNSSALNFGVQTNNNLNTTHNSFTHPVETHTSGKSSSNTSLANSTASSLSSPFVFGSSSTTTEQATPSKPFSFGSQQSSLAVANSSQLPVPSFNSTSVGFGVNPQPPAFSSVIPQPATPVFAFGQGSTSAQNFQFSSAGSQPVGKLLGHQMIFLYFKDLKCMIFKTFPQVKMYFLCLIEV